MSKTNNSKLVNWFKKTEDEEAQIIPETSKIELDTHNRTDYTAQDKISMDLMSSVEQVLKSRQLLLTKNDDLEEQIENNMNNISNLKREQEQQDRKISSLENTISRNEERLLNKQMNYDQLLEDYEEFQRNTKNQIEDLKERIAKEQEKYAKLVQEFQHYQEESLDMKRDLEETIRTLEVDNDSLEHRYQATMKEKNKLLRIINDFTSQMANTSSQTDGADKKSEIKIVPKIEEI